MTLLETCISALVSAQILGLRLCPDKSPFLADNRARRQSGFPTFISCQRQDAHVRVLPKRRQSHQGDKLCDVSTVPLVARWPIFLARGSDADGEPHSREGGSAIYYDATTDSVMKLVSCGTDGCHSVYDVCVTPSALIYFTDNIQRKVTAYDSEVSNAVDVCGKETECLVSVDGCEGSAVLVQPTDITCERETLYACDTGAGSMKLVSPISPFVRYMDIVNPMMTVFGIHRKFPAGLQDTIKSLNDTVAYLNEASAQT